MFCIPSGVKIPQPLGQLVHCTTLPVKSIPLIASCNFLPWNLWLLPLGFPVPPSGKGMFCPITPLLQRWAADSFSPYSPTAPSGTFPQSCSPILSWWIVLLGYRCKNVDLSSLNPMKRLSAIPAASEQRLCSPKQQLQFPQVHVICRHGEGAIPLLHPGCIIHPCVTAWLFCNVMWMNLFFTISC